MNYSAKILKTELLNHNVKSFYTEKPIGLTYTPGQAVLIELPELKGEKHPFTFTVPPDEPNLEFTIKLYHKHHGVTDRLTKYEKGDLLRFGEPWGAIEYKGPGLFLAGGAGVTPFLAILKMLHRKGNTGGVALWFSNKTDKDVFLEDELRELLGEHLRLLVTDQPVTRYENARIDKEYLRNHVKNFEQFFYLCGPDKMVEELSQTLRELGVKKEKIVMEDLS